MSNSYYKYCIVPMCRSTSIATPDKIFICVPRNESMRKKWCQAMKRDEKKNLPLSTHTVRHVCEDHFELEKDMENYMRYKLQGCKIYMKKGVVPHIFHCQRAADSDRPTGKESSSVQLVSEEVSAQHSNSSNLDVMEMAECEGNESPPTDNYDFDIARVGERITYLSSIGKPCQYINIIDEDAFITPSGSEETELSSDESVSSKDSSKRSFSIPPTSSITTKVKEEKFSDSEDSLISKNLKQSPPKAKNLKQSSPKLKSLKQSPPKTKSSKQSSPKPKKWPVVEYSDSDNSEEDRRKARHKKHSDEDRHKKKYSSDSDEGRSKVRRKKHSNDRSEDRSRSHRKKYSSDSDEGRSKARRKKHLNDRDEDRSKSRHKNYSDESDDDRSKSYQKKDYSYRPVKKEDVEEREFKFTPGSTFGTFHCQVCDINVNSEVTYHTHLQGKRHQKALKAKAVPDIVKQSLNETRIAPTVVTAPRAPVSRVKRVRLNVESLIQRVAEDFKDGPLPGLSNVVEIRPPVEGVRDVSYLCELCDAQCVPNSIMKHLTGFKHYLRCLEKVDPSNYERHRYDPKKEIEGKVKRILLDHEKVNGRGRICVEKEVPDEYPRRDEPGPSWRLEGPLPPVAHNNEDDDCQFVSAVEHLDTSMSDFYCRACDAHMNNQAMWESHVRGKRHLKNIKKVPGESTSKIKSVQCTGETAHLMAILNDLDDKDEYGNDIVIVGLGYIKETQGEGGDLYNCYLCGACTSSYDIIDHLNQAKHKIKYLEEMNAKGYPNSIEQIKAFSGFSAYSKECMINDECRLSLEKYGEGKVSVYRSKNMFPTSYSSRP